MNETFKDFKERVVHPQDDLFAILFINPVTVMIAYLIVEYNINITPNMVTYTRMFFLGPSIILMLIVLPWWPVILILSYLFLCSDWLDGQIARGSNRTSSKGAILDSIADRYSTIIMLVLVFSVGTYYSSPILVSLSLILFSMKCFHMMMITKLYYYKVGSEENSAEIFGGADATEKMGVAALFRKARALIKIKKWGGTLGGSDRFFITVMFPIILILSEFRAAVLLLMLAFSIFLLVFFLIRIKNLFRMIK